MRKLLVVIALLGSSPLTDAEPANRFANPSFEIGREPWISLAAPDKDFWHDFSVAPDPKNPAGKSARLDLSGAGARAKSEVWGVVQEVQESRQIPRYLHGRYFVENWRRGTAHQYIQVVVNIWTTTNYFGKRGENQAQPLPLQIAFVLAGISDQPFQIGNRKFVFAGPAEPKLGEWIDFEFDVRAALEKSWGSLPNDFRGFRVLFEVRFDGRAEEEKDSRATVYFDDLYFGDDSRNPPKT